MTAGGLGTSKRAGVVGSVAVALGIAAALAGGIGPAHADDATGTGTSAESSASSPAGTPTTAEPSTKKSAAPKTAVRRSLTAAAPTRAAADVFTAAPEEAVIAGIADPTTPTPADAVSTAYGDIGKWMLKASGQIADWGGKRHGGKKLLESVNVIIVDPHSTTGAQANRGLNNAMLRSRFPAQPLHNTGFRGNVDGVTYGQKPHGPLQAYSNNFFLFRNDHGRFFGPDPIQTDAGFVWSGAFSTERVGFSGLLPGHVYVSSNAARDALATALISGGQATYGGLVPLENAYNTPMTTTGDHDGFAVVLVLTGSAPLQRREVAMGSPTRFVSGGDRRDLACAAVYGTRSTADDRDAPLPQCGAVRLRSLDI